MDFRNNKVVLFINGKNRDEKIRSLRPMNGKLSDAKHLPMVFRLGHYFFDNKPIIGKLINVNIWARSVLK